MKELGEKNDFDLNSLKFNNNLNSNNGKYYTELNRLMHSKQCIYLYIFLIISSVLIFLYSIVAYFLKWNETPIVVLESILIVIITFDVLIRIYVAGCRAYFTKVINYIDLFLILLSFFTIFMYLKFHNTAQEIEDISFALLIFIRNSSQLLRLFVLIRNQLTIAKNVEEIINLNDLYEEKKKESLTMKKSTKNSHAIMFVDEDLKRNSSAQNQTVFNESRRTQYTGINSNYDL